MLSFHTWHCLLHVLVCEFSMSSRSFCTCTQAFSVEIHLVCGYCHGPVYTRIAKNLPFHFSAQLSVCLKKARRGRIRSACQIRTATPPCSRPCSAVLLLFTMRASAVPPNMNEPVATAVSPTTVKYSSKHLSRQTSLHLPCRPSRVLERSLSLFYRSFFLFRMEDHADPPPPPPSFSDGPHVSWYALSLSLS